MPILNEREFNRLVKIMKMNERNPIPQDEYLRAMENYRRIMQATQEWQTKQALRVT